VSISSNFLYSSFVVVVTS